MWKAGFKHEPAKVRDQILNQNHQKKLATLVQLGQQNLHFNTPEFAAAW